MSAVRALVALTALLACAAAPVRAANITDGLSTDQIGTLTKAFADARKQSRACFDDVALPGGAVMLNLTIDGTAGQIRVDSVAVPEVAPSVSDCVKAAYAAQTGPKFDGPPRITSMGYRPRDR